MTFKGDSHRRKYVPVAAALHDFGFREEVNTTWRVQDNVQILDKAVTVVTK